MNRVCLLCAVFSACFVCGCTPPHHIRHPVAPGDLYFMWVTWYGEEFKGRSTASGEPYDPSQFTCAAEGFPFGTMLEVRDMDGDKAVVVRVTDRPGDRVVDLTPQAFKRLSPDQKGRIRGKVTVIGLPGENSLLRRNEPQATGKFFSVQLGAFSSFDRARSFIASLGKDLSEGAYIYVEQGDTTLYRVRVGRFPDRDGAERFREQYTKGHEAVVVEVSE